MGKIPKPTTGKLITPVQKENTVKRLLEIPKERFISPQETTNYWWISINIKYNKHGISKNNNFVRQWSKINDQPSKSRTKI